MMQVHFYPNDNINWDTNQVKHKMYINFKKFYLSVIGFGIHSVPLFSTLVTPLRFYLFFILFYQFIVVQNVNKM